MNMNMNMNMDRSISGLNINTNLDETGITAIQYADYKKLLQ